MSDILDDFGINVQPKKVDVLDDFEVQTPSVTERNVNAMKASVSLDNPVGLEQKDVAFAVDQDQAVIERIARSRFTPEQIAEFKANPLDVWDGFHLALPVYSTAQDAATAYNIYDIGKKYERGEELSQGEQKTLDEFVSRHVEEKLRGTTIMHDIAYGLSELPAFAAELWASGGIGKIAQFGAVKVAKKYAKSQVISKVAGIAANVAARSAVFSPHIAKKYAERRITDSMSVTDKGDLIMRESTESPAKSALMAYSYTAAEVASELAGGPLGKYVINPVAGKLKTPLISAVNNLPVGIKQGIYNAFRKIKPNAQVSKVFTAGGWNGMLAELGEERINDVMRGAIAVAANDTQAAENAREFTAKDFFNSITPSGNQLLVEAGVISIAQGARTSADVGFNLLKNRGLDPIEAKAAMDTMSANEQEQLVDGLLEWPQSNFFSPVDDVNNAIKGATEPLTDAARAATTPKEFVTLSKQAGVDVAMDNHTAENFMASAKGGYYDIAQNTNTDLFGTGHLTDQVYTDTSAANNNSDIRLYDAATKAIEDVEAPPILHEESMADQFITQFRDDLWPINKLGEMAKKDGLDVEGFKTKKFSPLELTTRMYSTVLTQTQWTINHAPFYYDKEGKSVDMGKALKPILDDFDNYFISKEGVAENRRKDFTDYLIAQRYLQDLAVREDVEVTEEQRLKSVEDVAKLQIKYGEDFAMFDQFAKELYEYQKNVLYRLVVSGNMSQEKYDEILKKNQHYIPFQRVIEEEKLMRVTQNNPLFSDARSSAVIKSIHGSEAEVKNPIASIILNTSRIIDLSLRNDAVVQLKNYNKIMPQYVKVVPPQIVKKGTAKVKVTFDKRLRERLKKAIDFFGNEFEQKKTLNKKGQRGYIRGDYNPQEKLVRLRLGSSDSVMAHEVGHMLDFSLGLGAKMLKDSAIKKELLALAEERLSTDTVFKDDTGRPVFEDIKRDVESPKHKAYVKNDREIIANFYDAYVNAPELLDKIAPKSRKAFDDILDTREDLAFIKDIKPSLERAEEEIEQDVWGPSEFAPKGTLTFYENGEKGFIEVSKPILEAAKHLSPAQLNLFERLIVMPLTTVFRAGATLTPEFMVRSIPREGLTAIIQNRDVKFNMRNYARGFFSVVYNAVGGDSQLYKEFSRSAKFSNYQDLNEESIEKQFSSLVSGKGRVLQYVKNPLKILEEVGMSVDQIARVGAFDAAKQAGFSDYEAALISRDVFDYSRGGTLVKKYNQYTPFFKAAVNGSDKLYRAFKDRPVETAFWATMTVTLPSVAITSYYLYYAPDEDRKEYLEIPESLRSIFWFYKDEGEWKRIPKPFQLGQLFGTIPELAMIWMYDENRPEGYEMAKTVMAGLVESASPIADWSSAMPIIMKVPAEWASNYNYFFGKDIFPDFLRGKDPELRKAPWTSETAKELGKAFDVSPAKIDNAMRGLLAGTARYVTGTGDYFINKIREWNGQKVPEKPITSADVMIIRALSQRRPAGYRSNSYQTFKDRFNTVKQRRSSLRDYEGEKARAYEERYSKELSMYRSMRASKKEISFLGKQLDDIYTDKDMTSQEKVGRINEIEDQITEIARQANTSYNKVMRD